MFACLHPRHSIKDAVSAFGVNEKTSRLLIVVLSTTETSTPKFVDVCRAVGGKSVDVLTLYDSFNRDKVSEIYTISENEREACGSSKKQFIYNILTRMSVGVLTR